MLRVISLSLWLLSSLRSKVFHAQVHDFDDAGSHGAGSPATEVSIRVPRNGRDSGQWLVDYDPGRELFLQLPFKVVLLFRLFSALQAKTDPSAQPTRIKGCVVPTETQVSVLGPVQMLRAWAKKR
ncbi:hypothetical protein QC762_0048990 [Podospora pseudocomata]|uniref:Uncharacterized protein n=1 Tax=Podospora pseudocomata TaxID=2093779 RepID=A0ABR0GI10_9PEZI|nr:hypothetical protein QC762_0048990 [Podospora pseudocomata]